MDGPRDYHPKQSKSDTERQIPNDTAYMWNLKKNDTNELKNRLTDTENKLMVTKGERLLLLLSHFSRVRLCVTP